MEFTGSLIRAAFICTWGYAKIYKRIKKEMNNICISISKETARRFLLMKQGLFGSYEFKNKQGAYDYLRQAGCIQYDPVDAVGKNAELTLQSRVSGFKKKYLSDLLYKDRRLFDYPDKEISIIPMEDWPYFNRFRKVSRDNADRFTGLRELENEALEYIRKHGPVSSATLPLDGEIKWYSSIHWSGDWEGGMTKASRSVLEQLYTTGDLIIHHKEGSRKFYDLAEKHVPQEVLKREDPLSDEYDHIRWRVKRRIGAIGMLWNRNSTAFLGIWGLKDNRNRVFNDLLASGEILEVQVEGIKIPFYILADDKELLIKAADASLKSSRCEFLAPLDPMLWDRDLIRKIFDFSYTWEIYTPREKRVYGYYVLPVLYGDRLVGRIEPKKENGRMVIANIWFEPGIRRTKRIMQAVNKRMQGFARFNSCEFISNN